MEENFSEQVPKSLLPVWVRVVLYIVACFVTMGLFGGVSMLILSFLPINESVNIELLNTLLSFTISLIAVTFCAWAFLTLLDREPFSVLGLSIKGRGLDCIAGVLFAVVLYAIGFGIIFLTGSVSISSINVNIPVLVGSFLFFLIAASMEEIMVRGYILNRLMTTVNKFIALIISSVLFSVMHLGNPNIGVLPMVNLFLAGVLLGAAYIYTKNLWFPIMLHVTWNWLQGPVLGFEVSGTKVFSTMLNLNLPEQNIINGGSFGFEGSIICTILCIAGTLAIVGWYEYKGTKKVVPPQS